MRRAIFTFDTTHHALWGEEVARERGIPHAIVPAPPASNARCNIAIEVVEEYLGILGEALQQNRVPHQLYLPDQGSDPSAE
jgi:hypothetical protein